MRGKKILSFLLTMALVMGLTAVTTEPNVASAAKVTVKSVKVSAPYAKKAYVAKGKSIKLSTVVTVKPNKSANKKVTYKSSNKKIATVSSKGVVTGKKAGTTKITVTSKTNKKKKTTIKVKVMKQAVTKVKLNTSSETLKLGQTLDLKSTITPSKNVSKVVKWTSSNSSVAKVSSSGKVTALKVGTATIKVKAIDGSKKSASCKITVEDNTDMMSLEAINSSVIHVTLNKATSLSIADFAIQTKKTAEGNYTKSYEVKGTTTSDNINYYVEIDWNKEYLYADDYLKVTANALSGVKFKEIKIKYALDSAGLIESVITENVGKNSNARHIGFGSYITGEATYNVTGLPTGFYTKVIDGDLYICGKSGVVIDNVIATATATDELGKTATRNIRFLVGDKNAIVSYVQPLTVLSNRIASSVGRTVYVAGGSGSYTVNLVKDANLQNMQGVIISAKSGGYYFSNTRVLNATTNKYEVNSLPAGKYSASYEIKDTYNAAVSSVKTLDITVTGGAIVTGYLRDAAGEPIVGRYVSASCTSNNDISGFSSEMPTDATGKYVLRVVEGQTYDISGCEASAYKVQVLATGATADLKSPCYKVIVNTPVTGASQVYYSHGNFDELNYDVASEYGYFYLYDVSDYPTYDDIYVQNGVTYLLPGTYKLSTSGYTLTAKDAASNILGYYDAKVDVTLTNANIAVNAVMINELKATMQLDTPVNITVENKLRGIIEFTATEAGSYVLSSAALPADISFYGYYYDKNEVINNTIYLNAGEKITISIRNYEDDTIVITNLTVKKVANLLAK